MLYINSRVFKSEDIKNDVIFAFEINSDPLRAHPGVIIGGGAETYVPQNLMWYIYSRVFNGFNFENEIGFPYRIPSDPQ